MYKKLVEFHKSGILSFKYVKTFNMDEYVGEYNMKKNMKPFIRYLCLLTKRKLFTSRYS